MQMNVEGALAPSTINEKQMQPGVDVVETYVMDVIIIKMDLVKTIWT